MLTVVCLKWGTALPAGGVTVLYNAVRRNLDIPFRFICFTDDPSGLAPGIEARPILDIGMPPERWRSGCWPKLTIFKPGILDDADLAVYFDLDIIIRAPLAPFIERAGSAASDSLIAVFVVPPLRGARVMPAMERPSSTNHRACELQFDVARLACRLTPGVTNRVFVSR